VNETYLKPFGEVALESEPVRNNFRFPGQYHDRESMLYYNWNRYYMPNMGRYTAVDPLITISGYIYVDNNSVNNFDFWGLWTLHYEEQALINVYKRFIPTENIGGLIPSAYKPYLEGITLREYTWIFLLVNIDWPAESSHPCKCTIRFSFEPCIILNIKYFPDPDLCEINLDCKNLSQIDKQIKIHFIKNWVIK
jgi:RHS repeat-associated protein